MLSSNRDMGANKKMTSDITGNTTIIQRLGGFEKVCKKQNKLVAALVVLIATHCSDSGAESIRCLQVSSVENLPCFMELQLILEFKRS